MTGLQSNLNNYNNFQLTRTNSEVLPEKLANLSIQKKAYTEDAYSDIDRIVINDILNSTFDRDIYSKQSCAVITSFLGYPSDDRSTYRYKTLLKKCNDIINASNKNKSINANAVVILQTICDEKEAFSSSALLPQIEQIAKTHYVVLRLIGFQGETLDKTLSKISKDLCYRPIMTLIVRAHGGQDSLCLGNSNIYTIDDVTEKCFTALDPKGTIIFSSCHTGFNLAKKVASAIQPRSVFAYTKSCSDDAITLCCDDHGYGGVGFDSLNNQIARRFAYEKGVLTEVVPCCAQNKGIEKIKKALLDNKILAAGSGDANAQYDLGTAHEKGLNGNKSDKEASKLYAGSAIQGVAYAQYNLGRCYELGKGVTQSDESAIIWFRRAAEQGNQYAQYALGNYYMDGKVIPKSYDKAAKLYELSAQNGYASAQNSLGLCYSQGQGVPQSLENAVMWYRKAADQNNPYAQYNLGNFYYTGTQVPQSYDKAVDLYEDSAKQGHKSAQFKLGLCYEKGHGVPQSLEKAAMWYQKAAENGHANAQFNLGLCYEKGHGVPKNIGIAKMWYQKAAKQGHEEAQSNLGLYYKKGRVVLKSCENISFPVTKFTSFGNDKNSEPKLKVVSSTKIADLKPIAPLSKPDAKPLDKKLELAQQVSLKDLLNDSQNPPTPRKAIQSLSKIVNTSGTQSMLYRLRNPARKENVLSE